MSTLLDRPSPRAELDAVPDAPPTGFARLRTWFVAMGVGRRIVLVLTVLLIAYLTLTPLFYLLSATFIDDGALSLDSFARAFANPETGEMILASVLFALGTTVLAILFGGALAYCVVRTDVPFKPFLVVAAVIPVVIPSVLYIIAWVMLASPNVGLLNQILSPIFGGPVIDIFGMGGMIWVEALHNVPLVFLFMITAFRSMDSSLEESALVNGASRFTMLRRITLPLARPAIAGAALIIAIKTLGSFEGPAILGVPKGDFVFVSRIYFVMQDFPYDRAAAGALSIGLIVLALLGTWLLSRARGDGKSFATVTGKGYKAGEVRLGTGRWVVLALVGLFFLISTVLPIFVMLFNSFLGHYQAFSLDAFADFSLKNYVDVFTEPIFGTSLVNSLVLSIGAATTIMVITAVAAWITLRTKLRGRQFVDHLAFLPVVVPGLIIGLAVSFVYLRNPLPFQIYGTLGILLVAYVTAFLPYGMRYAVSALERISVELEESAVMSGARWAQVMRRVVLPLMFPGLLAGWILLVIVSARELSASILLYSPGTEVLSILIFHFYEEGRLVSISALGVILVLFFSVFVGVAFKIGSKVGIQP